MELSEKVRRIKAYLGNWFRRPTPSSLDRYRSMPHAGNLLIPVKSYEEAKELVTCHQISGGFSSFKVCLAHELVDIYLGKFEEIELFDLLHDNLYVIFGGDQMENRQTHNIAFQLFAFRSIRELNNFAFLVGTDHTLLSRAREREFHIASSSKSSSSMDDL